MGNRLFGIDVAGLVKKHIAPGLLPAVLTRKVEGARSADLTAGREVTEVAYPCRAIWQDYKPDAIDGNVVVAGDRMALIIGDTLPAGVTPREGDAVSIKEDHGTSILPVQRLQSTDPARAAFVVQCGNRSGRAND